MKATLTDLVEKRLWPVAALLVALLVAVPMTLAKPGPSTETPMAPTVTQNDDEGPQLALTRSSTTGFARPPRVNDKRLDPFGARGNAKIEAVAKSLSDAANEIISAGGSDVTPAPDTGGGGVTPNTGSGDDGAGSEPKPEKTTPPETEQDDLLTILLTSEAEAPVERTDIRTLSPLPDPDNPFLVYVGRADGDKASFLVSADVAVTGDGACSPSPQDCRTLTMGIGDTADFTMLTGENAKKVISMTVTDLETKKVLVDDAESADPDLQLEAASRAAGARALKSVLGDPEVVAELARRNLRIRN